MESLVDRRSVLCGTLGLALGAPATAFSATTRIAVAANFAPAADQLVQQFAARTGHRVVLSYGATGQLFAQISQGAPFSAFLAADDERPKLLEKQGKAVRGSCFTYATGRLVLWSRTPGLVDNQATVLRQGRFRKLAIAEPAAAPYGVAAMEVLRKLKLEAAVGPKIVKGASVAQAYQFAATGAADLAFVSLAQVIGSVKGSRWLVPQNLHSPIRQQAALLKRDPVAKAFLDYLRTKDARRIIRRFGYIV